MAVRKGRYEKRHAHGDYTIDCRISDCALEIFCNCFNKGQYAYYHGAGQKAAPGARFRNPLCRYTPDERSDKAARHNAPRKGHDVYNNRNIAYCKEER